MLRSTMMHRSPRIVPGNDSSGRVAPASEKHARLRTNSSLLNVQIIQQAKPDHTEQVASTLDDTWAFPDHSHDWARREKSSQTLEEWLAVRSWKNKVFSHSESDMTNKHLSLQVVVVLSSEGLGGSDHLHRHQLVAARLEALDDLADKISLHAIRLDLKK